MLFFHVFISPCIPFRSDPLDDVYDASMPSSFDCEKSHRPGETVFYALVSGPCAALVWFCLSRCILCSLSTVRPYLILVTVSIVGRTNFSHHTISLAPSPHHLHFRRRGPCMPQHEQTSVSVFVSRYPVLLRRAVGHSYILVASRDNLLEHRTFCNVV